MYTSLHLRIDDFDNAPVWGPQTCWAVTSLTSSAHKHVSAPVATRPAVLTNGGNST